MATKAVSNLKKTLDYIRKAIVCDADRAAIEPYLRDIVGHFKADRPVKIVEVESPINPHAIKVQEQRICALKKQLQQEATLHNEAVGGLTFKVNQLTKELARERPSLEGKTDEELLGHLTQAMKTLEGRLNEIIKRTSSEGRARVGFFGLVIAMAALQGSLLAIIDANDCDLDRSEATRDIAGRLSWAVRRILEYYEIDVNEVWSAGTLEHYKDALQSRN